MEAEIQSRGLTEGVNQPAWRKSHANWIVGGSSAQKASNTAKLGGKEGGSWNRITASFSPSAEAAWTSCATSSLQPRRTYWSPIPRSRGPKKKKKKKKQSVRNGEEKKRKKVKKEIKVPFRG